MVKVLGGSTVDGTTTRTPLYDEKSYRQFKHSFEGSGGGGTLTLDTGAVQFDGVKTYGVVLSKAIADGDMMVEFSYEDYLTGKESVATDKVSFGRSRGSCAQWSCFRLLVAIPVIYN